MALNPGWIDYGTNGLVRNTKTNQIVGQKDPIYTAYSPGGSQAPAAPAGPPQTTIPGQTQAASTYSPTPTAAPTAATTNQGGQDVWRNTLMSRMTQPETFDPTHDPAFRMQSDTFAAAAERARRDQVAQNAESFTAQGLGGSGAQQVQDRMAGERSMQVRGQFEGDLAAKEVQNRRDEIAQALSMYGSQLSQDQQRALQLQLAQLDAQLRREGIASQEKLGMSDIDLRRTLGMGQLDLGRATLGANVGMDQAQLNQQAMLALLGGA